MRSSSLRVQLAILLSVMSLLLVGGILLAVSLSFSSGFRTYLEQMARDRNEVIAARLSSAIENDPRLLQRFRHHPPSFERWLAGQAPGSDRRPPPPPGFRPFHGQEPPSHFQRPRPREEADWHRPPPPPPANGPAVWLLEEPDYVLAGPPLPPEVSLSTLLRTPLDPAVAPGLSLAWRPARPLDNHADTLFFRRQQLLFAGIALVAVIGSVLLSWPLSRYLVTPIEQISSAVRALSSRRYDQRVDITARNELGDLGRDVNRMADALQAHDEQQRQWLADVSHELRTPLAVMKGELESLQDGMLPFDASAVSSLQEEVGQLTRLVDDLHQLVITQSGKLRYHFARVDLCALITRLEPRLAVLVERAGLHWEHSLPQGQVFLEADEQRLEQLIMNLAQNSVRYTHRGGRVRVTLGTSPVPSLVWEDSEPGVGPDDLEHLFDRFYRVEKSQQRAVGGSGIGLSIVANIAEAHGAIVSARASMLGGLCIDIRFNPSGRAHNP